MIALRGSLIVTVRVTYDLTTGRIEVNAEQGNGDAVLVALQKAVYAVLAGTVKVAR